MEETIKYFTQQELKKIFKAIEKTDTRYKLRDLAMFRIGYCCGLRVSEVGLLQLQHYNRASGELYCTRLKGSWNNTIRLNKEAKKALDTHIKAYNIVGQTERLFRSQEQNPISRKTLDYLAKKYCAAANIEDQSKHHFHALKHSCGVHLADSGLDIKEVNFWLGHKNINNTMCYFRFTSKQQERMYKKLENCSNMV